MPLCACKARNSVLQLLLDWRQYHDQLAPFHLGKLLDHAEYKRRQACPGVKISRKAFGRDRRYPITNKFTDLIVENG